MKRGVGHERGYSTSFEGRDDIVLWDVVDIASEQMIKVTFVSTKSPHKQGIRLAVDVGKGHIEANGIHSKDILLWEHTAPKEIICKCISPEGLLSVYNIWEENGRLQSQCYTSGMLIEEEGTKRTYHCNDYGLDTQFDNLVFTLELL